MPDDKICSKHISDIRFKILNSMNRKIYFIVQNDLSQYEIVADFFSKQSIDTEVFTYDWQKLIDFPFQSHSFIFFSYPQPKHVQENRYLLSHYLKEKNPSVFIINYATFQRVPIINKLIQKKYFIDNQMLTPKHWYFTNLSSLITEVKKIHFPLIIKRVNGSESRDIKIVSSSNDLLSYLSDKLMIDFYFEKLIKTDYAIKVFIVKNGFYYPDPELSYYGKNYSGVNRERPSRLTLNKIKPLAKKTDKVYILDYGGIDFLVKGDLIYAIEVNLSPKFRLKEDFLKELLKLFH